MPPVPRAPAGARLVFGDEVQGCAEYRDPWLPSRHPAGMPSAKAGQRPRRRRPKGDVNMGGADSAASLRRRGEGLTPGTPGNILQEMNYLERITIDPRVRSGKACIRGTRISVSDVFDYLGGGMSVQEVLDDFPDLTMEDIRACFAYAADRDRRLNVVPNEVAV